LRAIVHPIFTGEETAVFWGWMPDGRLRLELRDQDLSAHATAPLKNTELQEGDLVEIQRRHGVTIALSRLEPRKNNRWLLSQPPDMDFSAVRGYDELVDQIRGPLELQLFHPEVAVRNHVEHAYGIILFGRPGNGKTHVVRALAGWLNRTSGGKAGFIHVRPGELASMWFGESQRLIRELFASARKHAAEAGGPCIVMLDELDSIGAARSFGSSAPENRVSQALMAEIDGLEPRGNVVVIGTTNRLDALDPAITRSGRFGDNFIEVKGPNREAAYHLIDHYLPESLPFHGGAKARPGFVDALLTSLYAPNGDTKLSRILFREGSQEVNVADLISCADIKKICKQAALANARREAAGVRTGIAAEDLLAAADREKDRLASLLTPHNTRNYMTGLPMDVQVVRVERLRDQASAQRRRYLRIAEAA
jgi:proteasome-associated ATPase